MTSDLVKQLRLSADAFERATFKSQAAQLREAADRIEALEADNRNLRLELLAVLGQQLDAPPEEAK